MRNMNPVSGIYPNRCTRNYAAVLECAREGNTEIAVVPVEHTEE